MCAKLKSQKCLKGNLVGFVYALTVCCVGLLFFALLSSRKYMFALTTHEYTLLCDWIQTQSTSWQKAGQEDVNTNESSLAWIHKTAVVIIAEKPLVRFWLIAARRILSHHIHIRTKPGF